MSYKKYAKRFLELSLNPVPVSDKNKRGELDIGSKVPIRKDHTEPIPEEEIESYKWNNIGISTGYSSLNLEVLDFDLDKVENPTKFMEEYTSLIPKDLFDKLVRSSTKSGGFHFLYRCEHIESSQKLARNLKGEATIETRGIGGYIKCYPSKGYEIVSEKSFDNIPLITEKERSLLFILAKQKDELKTKDIYKRFSQEEKEYFKRFPDYNKNPEVGVELLKKHGWTVHSESDKWINFTRPNSTSGDLHGGYSLDGYFFQTFSTAQDTFITGKGYNNHHLFCELECKGDYKKGYAKLYDSGNGIDIDEVEEEDGVILDFLSDEIEENSHLDQARKGEIAQGLTTGWATLDKNLRWKPNSFVFCLGLDNIGKSTLLSSFMVAMKVLHGLKFGISSPEAKTSTTRRNLIEAESGRKIVEFKDSPVLYDDYLRESRKNFFIINNKRHWTIEEILDKGRVLYEQHQIDYLIIDPYSFYSGSGDFSSDNDILSKIRVFAETYCSVIVVDHPFTGFTRIAKDDSGFLRIPTKYEVSGGNGKANRTDDFISFHRIINHPDKDIRKTMQISVGKIKDTSTGGMPHIDGEWSELVYETRNGFLGYWDSQGNNPMYRALQSKIGVRQQLKGISPEEAF